MKATLTFSDANFDEEVVASQQPVLVDVWAAWCPPCRALGPTIDELAESLQSRAKVGKLNVDDNPVVAARYGISSLPTVLVFREGEVVERLVGVQSKQRYEQALAQAVASTPKAAAEG